MCWCAVKKLLTHSLERCFNASLCAEIRDKFACCKLKVKNFYNAFIISALPLMRSDRPVCNNGITWFYLPPTHEPYLPLLPSRKVSQFFGCYSFHLSHERFCVLLGNWSYYFTTFYFLLDCVSETTYLHDSWEFCQLLKTHLFCRGQQRLLTCV